MALVKRNRQRRITVQQAKERVQSLADVHLPSAPPEYDIMERECILCMSAPRHVRFACGHSTLCQRCLDPFLRTHQPVCPYCREPVARSGMVQSDAVANEDTFVRPLHP